MAKIILTKDGNVVQEMVLHKERTTIGRRLHNDMVIDHPAVSGQHAVIVTISSDSFLEDLNSTNGTQVNGHPISKHFLQHKDVIQMTEYQLTYLVDTDPDIKDSRPNMLSTPQSDAIITIIDGPSPDKTMPLTKVLTTIGRPGVQVAIITRRPNGYELTHVEGSTYTSINGTPLSGGARPLLDGDVIDIAGTMVRFSWRSGEY
ncbi:FHA domain-containing protein [Glaciimonas sp. GG7]